MAFSIQIRQPEPRVALQLRQPASAADRFGGVSRHDWFWFALPAVLIWSAFLPISFTIPQNVSLATVSAGAACGWLFGFRRPRTRDGMKTSGAGVTRTLAAIFLLTKPGLIALVLATTFAGFWVGSAGTPNLNTIVPVLIGTAMVAGGALALNEYAERDLDRIMRRTARRPLPSGRLEPAIALRAGIALAIAGLWVLAASAPTAAFLAGIACLVYVGIYTPLKRASPVATLVGALAGALPPVIGWSAANERISSGAWILFLILFFWQVPHFLAIGWRWRLDYRAAGIPIYCVLDPTGRATGVQTMIYAACLIVVSVMPVSIGMTGRIYIWGAPAIGLLLLGSSAVFAFGPSPPKARQLFIATIIYLPILMGMMML